MGRKKVPSELELAEVKYQNLLDKRDGYNDEARVLREDRDLLHAQARGLREEMRALRERRDALVAVMRQHKGRRNELQGKAKDLIALKRKLKGKVKGSVAEEIAAARAAIASLETRQETGALSLDQENALLEELRRRRRALVDLETLRSEQERIDREVGDLDARIDALFRDAEAEHQRVVALSEEASGLHEGVTALVREIAHLQGEADKKHEAYVKVKERADYYHGRAVEMRQKILSSRETRRREIQEARTYIRDQNEAVRKTFTDEARRKALEDAAVRKLLEKGRVEL
jgi:uncharacterized coiled-coil DUF342 family protein